VFLTIHYLLESFVMPVITVLAVYLNNNVVMVVGIQLNTIVKDYQQQNVIILLLIESM
jgi:hypothetical protein